MKRNGWNVLLVLQFVAGLLLFASGLFGMILSDGKWLWNLLLLVVGLGAMLLAARRARGTGRPIL
ncbi:hypothetical protein VH571_10515 [Frondihabitans sp. 4ASC-45]|uniref:hypothetical protein n=1 Tax=Frondihabitans sp. 4ASC-45 TaxID=3111636 RepID=UPI003C179FF1